MEDFDNHIPLKAEEDDQFPIGLKVLAIDNNIVCLRYLAQLLKKCQYKGTSSFNFPIIFEFSIQFEEP